MCQFRDEDDCIFFFAYEYNSNIVYAQRTKGMMLMAFIIVSIISVVILVVIILGINHLFVSLEIMWKWHCYSGSRYELKVMNSLNVYIN